MLTYKIYENLEKIAKQVKDKNKEDLVKSKNDQVKDADNKALAGASVAGGGAIGLSKLDRSGELTGTRKGYHVTDKKSVPSIKEKGILTTDKIDESKSITKLVARGNSDFSQDLGNKVYVANNKGVAKSVALARQQNGIADAGGQEIVKTRIPYSEYKKRKTFNPETVKFKDANHYADSIRNKLNENIEMGNNIMGRNDPTIARKGLKGKLYKELLKQPYRALEHGTDVLKGDIAPEHIKGGKGYSAVKSYGKNFARHVKDNPKVFAKGLAKGTLGAGAVGVGGKMFLDAGKKKQELEKSASYEFENTVNNIFNEDILKLTIKKCAMYDDMMEMAIEKSANMDMDDSLEKLAAESKLKEEDKEKANKLIGTGAVAVGGKKLIDLEHSGEITGTRKGYHVTDKKNVKGIKEKGILPTDKVDKSKSITEFVPGRIDPRTKDAFNNKSYVANKKNVAYRMGYVRKQTGVADKDGQTLIKTRMPYSEYQKRKRKNPELMDFKNKKEYTDKKIEDFVDEVKTSPMMQKFKEKSTGESKLKEKLKPVVEKVKPKNEKGKQMSGSMKKVFINKNPAIRGVYNSVHKALDKGTDTLEGVVDSKYIKGGKGYNAVKSYKNNFVDHVKNNPKVLAKGVGKGVASAGMVGVGGKMLLDAEKKKRETEKTACLDDYKEVIYKEAGVMSIVKGFAKKILPKAKSATNAASSGAASSMASSAIKAPKGLSEKLKAGENIGNGIKSNTSKISPLSTNTSTTALDAGKKNANIPFKEKAKIAGRASMGTLGAAIMVPSAVKSVKESIGERNTEQYQNQQGFTNTTV